MELNITVATPEQITAFQLAASRIKTNSIKDSVAAYNEFVAPIGGKPVEVFPNRGAATAAFAEIQKLLTPEVVKTDKPTEIEVNMDTTQTVKTDGRGRGNKGKSYKEKPVERHEKSVRTFLTDEEIAAGVTISRPFSHSELAQLSDCAWLSSVTMVSNLRIDFGMSIFRVGKIPARREGVPAMCQAPANMEQENIFIWFERGATAAEEYLAAKKAEDAKKKQMNKAVADAEKAKLKAQAATEKLLAEASAAAEAAKKAQQDMAAAEAAAAAAVVTEEPETPAETPAEVTETVDTSGDSENQAQ